jgi:glucokinase
MAMFKEFSNSGDFAIDVENIETTINNLSDNQKIEGIGTCVPGIINEKKDTIKLASNIQHWVNKPIKQVLEEKYLTKVVLDNDALAATTAEAFFGNYDSKNFLYVQWGTGIGGSYVLRNPQTNKLQILPSELGHQIIQLDGEQCGCGQKGCLELYISGGNFLK